MLFYEPIFLFLFLPATLAVHHLLPARARNGWLFLASCAFYSASSLAFLPILLLSVTVDFALGRVIHGARTDTTRKAWLCASVALNLGLLGFFKYAGWITHALRELTGWTAIPALSVPLPVGISFYTFQSMSYTIDIYRRQATPARSWIDFGAFVTLFPQLIAGPIVRYDEMDRELRERKLSADRFAGGVRFFVLGLAKKILVADTAAALADPLFALGQPGFAAAWASVLLYSFQIYFDFSGYSDMAVGLGKMLGFEFPRNFNSPYKATSFSDFWSRWHMTLSRWLRDNLYVPLGGNRRGRTRTYWNLFATMLLGGLWHGAGWSYLIWGAFHGGLLAIERALGDRNPLLRWPAWARRALVFACVSVGWVFFRAGDFSRSIVWLGAMLVPDWSGPAVPWNAWVACGLLLGSVWLLRGSWELNARFDRLENALVTCGFVACVVVALGKGSSPFLYFQF